MLYYFQIIVLFYSPVTPVRREEGNDARLYYGIYQRPQLIRVCCFKFLDVFFAYGDLRSKKKFSNILVYFYFTQASVAVSF